MRRTSDIAALVLAIAILFPAEASAYLDPGSGSMVFQAVIAGLAGVAYGVRMYWGKIRGVFSRRTGSQARAEDELPPGS